MQINEMLRDRQPDSKPTVRARRSRVSLTEAVEDVRQKFARDADAVVANAELHVRVDASNDNPNFSAFVRVLYKIRKPWRYVSPASRGGFASWATPGDAGVTA